MQVLDIDTLHILPLSHIPLETRALRKARLIKNARLESMVELFGENMTGSGQIPPDKLYPFFDFSGPREQDYNIIRQLGSLPSYDIYSLRVTLRKLDIDLDDLEGFKLTDADTVELTEYMAEFTRPLVRFVYGDSNVPIVSMADMLHMFADPNAAAAKDNLRRMAYMLGVDLSRIPKFLADYADVYMSLSFYRQCLERIAPLLADFIDTLHTIRSTRSFADNRGLIVDCALIEDRLNSLFGDVAGILDEFRNRTEDMWDNMSAQRYRQMELMVLDHQARIGGILCALTVKMNAWHREFPIRGDGLLSAKAAFAIGEMKHGLSRIEPLTFEAV